MCEILFGGISKSELNILCYLVDQSLNNTIILNNSYLEELKSKYDVSASAVGTSVFRMEKKGVLSKSGKTIMLHPIFNNVLNLNALVINFH